jgi:hypothetical protein
MDFFQEQQINSGDAGEDKGQEGAAQAEEGQASASQMESKLAAPASQEKSTKKETRDRRKPGKADSTHTLGIICCFVMLFWKLNLLLCR